MVLSAMPLARGLGGLLPPPQPTSKRREGKRGKESLPHNLYPTRVGKSQRLMLTRLRTVINDLCNNFLEEKKDWRED